jgi:hypothetical protein
LDIGLWTLDFADMDPEKWANCISPHVSKGENAQLELRLYYAERYERHKRYERYKVAKS